MSQVDSHNTVTVQRLLGRKVYDADGTFVGRVFDLLAEAEGTELCVTALVVGYRTWVSRFSWVMGRTGREIPWDTIETLSPHIRVRREIERES